MKPSLRLPSRAATIVLVAALGASAPFLTQTARTAPKKQQLEIWPGRRVILVLPLSISSNWNSDPALGRAILPLAEPQLERALTRTGKFSLTFPYRFDPVLRRGLTEKRLVETELTALLTERSLESSRPVIDKLVFDQPVMTTQVRLEEVRVGGTALLPTVQLQVSGSLYEQGNPEPIKSITVTSDPSGGKTPSDRLTLAASRAFDELAAAFIAPPEAFQLPTPIPPTPAPTTAATPGATRAASGGTSSTSAAGSTGTGSTGAGSTGAGSTAPRPIAPPTPLSPAPGTPLVPQLPAGQPPLGIAVGEAPVAG